MHEYSTGLYSISAGQGYKRENAPPPPTPPSGTTQLVGKSENIVSVEKTNYGIFHTTERKFIHYNLGSKISKQIYYPSWEKIIK